MIFLATVWHSGTHSLKSAIQATGRDDIYHHHCGWDSVLKCQEPVFEWIATTLRDPYEVGASWGNRGELDDGWFEQWDAWGEIAQMDKTTIYPVPGEFNGQELGRLNGYADEMGLHAALKKGDMNYYHELVPVRFIEHAESVIDAY